MNRNIFWKTALAAMALVLSIGFYGCESQNGVNADNNYEYLSIALPDADFNRSDIEDATLDKDMTLVEREMCFREDREMNGKGNKGRMPIRQFHPFARIFGALQLTDDQKLSIRGFMADHFDCMKEALEALRLSERAIIQEANTARREIMQSFRNGDITREEARQQLNDLNAETRSALQNNPAREEARLAMCECILALYANIRAELDETQQTMWDRWVAAQNLPCDEE